MTWEILNIIGTIAFVISGAIVAMEEDYDILGILVLGFTTAFGGGTVRNLLIGIPIDLIWQQGKLFVIAFIVIIILFLLPQNLIKLWNHLWGIFFDAIGLAAFAIQGALLSMSVGAPLSATMVAATLTGVGGGAIRDVLAGRKPLIFRDEIYGLWALIGGLMIGLGFIQGPWSTMALFIGIVVMRMISYKYKWRLPHKSLSRH